MARPDSPPPRRGRGLGWVDRRRGVRRWGTVDDRTAAEITPPPADLPLAEPQPTATLPEPPRHGPRQRYPWHDDPDYDPSVHRRTPPPQPWTPPPAPTTSEPYTPDHRPPPGPRDDEPLTRTAPRRIDPDATSALRGEDGPRGEDDRPTPRMPRKLTVTRVAALRSRELTRGGIRAFHRAASADGAGRSGLTALTYATMMSYAVDAAVTVALANTLFFAAATAESKANVALYLIITVAPFAVVAPVVGPLLDRLQRGRRAALAVSFGGRALLAVVMAFNYDTWLLYPAALGALVLSKSFSVLKAAVTPRVLPRAITLVTTNSRLTTFGMAAAGVFGAIAGGIAWFTGSPGALFFTAALAVLGTVLCLRIPRWVESTAGEVPAALRSNVRGKRRPIGQAVAVALWGNGAIRVLTGFLTLFVAFVVREQSETDPARQLFLIGIIGAAAGAGSFIGNAAGSRRQFGRSDTVILVCIAVAVAVAACAAVLPGIPTAALVGLLGAGASATAKVCLDAIIQRDLPEESRASAFGRSETVLQLAWVFGGALGVLLPHSTFWIGFTVVAGVVALGGVQTALVGRGRSLLPFLGPRRPTAAAGPARTGRP